MGGIRNFVSSAVAALALAVFLAGGTAFAKETILTEDGVKRFLASFGEMRNIAIAEGLKTGMDTETAKDPLGAVLRAIGNSKLKEQAEKSAKAHGFADLKDWSETGKAVGGAYLFITMGTGNKKSLEKTKSDALKMAERYGFVTADNKKKAKDLADSITDGLTREPPAANVAIVKKMKAEIDAAVKIGVE
jgi:hypothetical protein